MVFIVVVSKTRPSIHSVGCTTITSMVVIVVHPTLWIEGLVFVTIYCGIFAILVAKFRTEGGETGIFHP